MTVKLRPIVMLLALTATPITAALGQDQEATAVPVTVSEVRAENITPTVPAAGTVFSRQAAQITAGLPAQIEWIAEPGDYVIQGQPVARFDCGLLELRREEQLAQVDREKVNLKSLVEEVSRLEKARLATSINQLERVRANRDLAASEIRVVEVRIRQTSKELERCTALAPFSGVVTRQERYQGEDVDRGDILLSMTDTLHLEVRASVPIRYLPRIRAGGNAEIRMKEQRLQGTIRTAVPAADALSQTFEVRIDLPESAPVHVAAGQLVSVSLPLAANAALTVPRDSVVLRADGTYVMRIEQAGTARRVDIEVAEAMGERVAVRGNLSPGDRIAVRGAESLSDGAAVVIYTES